MKRSNPYIDLPLTVERVVWMGISVVIYLSQLIYGGIRGFLWFTLGKKTDEKRLRFHEAIWHFFNFCVKYHSLLNVRIHNPHGETFEKGAVIICNHQSMLDTICMLILSPRILLVTHDKVWNNPIVATMLRYADFFSVSDTEWSGRIDYCKSFIRKGYSIVIFPEGERSREGNILRFHKGAFFLAEQLQADILPVFIHGAAHIQPVGCKFQNKGCFYIEIGKRVVSDDTLWGGDYVQRCKNFHRYYVEHFEEIRYKIETPDYFSHLVIAMYASIGLRKQAINVLKGNMSDQWHIKNFVEALVNPEKEFEVPVSSPLKRIYDKYTHLPQNIIFV